MGFEVCELKEENIEQIAPMLVEMWVMHVKNNDLIDESKLTDCDVQGYLQEAIKSRDILALVAFEETKAVGFLRGVIKQAEDWYKEEKELYLDDLVVAKEFRRKGVGRILVQAAVNSGKKKNIKLVTAHIFEFNKASKGLFENLGFAADYTAYSLKETK